MQAAERELLEEVGLVAKAIAYLGTWMDSYGPPAADGLQEYTANSAYVMRTLGDESMLTPQVGEVSGIAWFGLDELPHAELAFPTRTRMVLEVASRFVSEPAAFPAPPDRIWA